MLKPVGFSLLILLDCSVGQGWAAFKENEQAGCIPSAQV